MADVNLVIGPHQREDRPGTRCGSLDPGKPLEKGLVIAPTRRVEEEQDALAPVVVQLAEELIEPLAGHPPRLVSHRSEGAIQHKGGRSLRIRGGEHQTHWAALRPAIDRRALRARRIHHRAHITDPFFERLFCDPIGEPLPALIENDHPGEGGEPFEQMLVARHLPQELDVREGAGDQHDVTRPVAENAVGDVNIAAPRVPDRSYHFGLSVRRIVSGQTRCYEMIIIAPRLTQPAPLCSHLTLERKHTICRSAARWMCRPDLTVVPSAANRPRPTHRWSRPPGGAPGPGGGAAPPVGSAATALARPVGPGARAGGRAGHRHAPWGGLHPAGARLAPPASRFRLERTWDSTSDGGPQRGWLRSQRSCVEGRSRPAAAVHQG